MKFRKGHILDELLIFKIQGDDMKAFSLLYQRWQPKLLKHAYRMTRDDEGALDVVQEAWQAISRGIKNLRKPEAFSTWAYRIVNNKSANWIKEQQKQREVRKEHVLEQYEEEGNDNLEIIRKALGLMPAKDKAALSLFYLEGHSVKEIAKIFSISEGTVKSRLFYARKLLKEKVENYKKQL
ncbi:MAG: RNA polymerase sigma factor [Bacteroidota bacterium]